MLIVLFPIGLAIFFRVAFRNFKYVPLVSIIPVYIAVYFGVKYQIVSANGSEMYPLIAFMAGLFAVGSILTGIALKWFFK